MSSYWIGICAGLFIGVYLGFTICAMLILAKKADRKMEERENE